MNGDFLDELYQVLLERKNAGGAHSYTASLYAGGGEKIGRKIVEESAEVLIEAVKSDPDNLIDESADLLFHLMVLWAHHDITPKQIINTLRARMGISGHKEKASRSG
jgi:phosphoribosyl-ATP pyrophosphohydrolase